MQTVMGQRSPRVDDLAVVADLWCLKPHQYLVHIDDTPSHLFRIRNGWAVRYRLLPDGRRQITGVYLPGDLCDPSWMEGQRCSQAVSAVTTLRVHRMPREDLLARLARDAALATSIMRAIHRSAAIQIEWTLNLGRKNAMERLSHFLCECYARSEAAGLVQAQSCDFPLTQIDVADVTGLTPVHVNRTLQDMRAAGLVELRSRRLVVPDFERLAGIGFFSPRYLEAP